MVYLFYAMLFSLPFSVGGWSVEFLGVTFHPYTLMVVALFPLAVFLVATGFAAYQVRLIDWVILALALSFLASTLLSEPDKAGWRIAFLALFIPITSYFVCRVFITSEEVYRRSVVAIGLGLLVFAVATVAVFAQTGTRPFVFEMPPIGVATLLVMGLIYSLYHSGPWNALRVGRVGLFGTALVLTFSRVYLLLAVTSPVLRWALRRWLVFIWAAMFAATLILTLAFTYGADLSRFSTDAAEGQNTMERLFGWEHIERAMLGRAFVYRESLADLPTHLVFGEGISVGEYQVTPHNFNVEWLKYGGVLGYLLYVGVFMANAVSAARRARHDGEMLVLSLAVLVVVLNSLTNGFMHGVMPFAAFLLIGMTQARTAFASRS